MREAKRVILVRRLRQRCQHRDFGERQLVERLLKISVSRGRDPVSAGAEIDFVQIDVEQPVLAQFLLDLIGEQCLLDLPRDRHFVGQQEVPDHLLGDRRGAHRALPRADAHDVAHRRPRDRQRVDAVVIVEIAIFCGEKRALH